jgi:hypothetical protein
MGILGRLLGAKDASPFVAGPDQPWSFLNEKARPDFALALSPVTGPEMYGLPNIQLFQTGAYPETDDGRQYSMEQGIGRSPGQQWPHMPHREQYSFDKMQHLGYGIMEDGTMDLPLESNANPIVGKEERAGWVLPGPQTGISYYYGQYVSQHEPKVDPISTEVPGTTPYTTLTEVPS